MKPSRIATLLTCTALLMGLGCRREKRDQTEYYKYPEKPASLPALDMGQPKSVAHPRMVLDAAMVERVKRHQKVDSRNWSKMERVCEIYSKKDVSSGYLGAYWMRAVINMHLCFKGTGNTLYKEKALHYYSALLSDRKGVGDGEGGNTKVVARNSGYPIRNLGVGAAIGYDWLYDDLNPEMRKKAASLLKTWISWYQEEGYLNDNAYSNYFWGYMSTLTLAGIAFHGDDPEADKWLAEAKRLFEEKIIPGFYTHLAGGEWAEGWQYGSLVSAELAFIIRAFETSGGSGYAENFPWFKDIISGSLNRQRPDLKSAYGNGTQESNPADPIALPLYSAVMVLEKKHPDLAAKARFVIHELYPEIQNEYAWLAVLADEPEGKPRTDPRPTSGLSYRLTGPGQAFMRSSWDKDASWVSFQLGPKIAIDHQDQDQGHYELWRGSDGLIVDAGAEHGAGTINHNSVLINDDRKLLRYSPSQGVWGKKVKIIGFQDDDTVAVIRGDLRDAWSPKCVKWGCDDHEVSAAERIFVYVRPNLVVTNDVIDLEHDDTWVATSAHVMVPPTLSARHASAVRGDSRVDLTMLLPKKGTLQAPKEPTETSDHPFRANRTHGDTWRIEVVSPEGTKKRVLRSWVQAGAKDGPQVVAQSVGGDLSGGVSKMGDTHIAVLFAATEAGGQSVLPTGTFGKVVIAGLKPEATYRRSAIAKGAQCQIQVAPDASGVATGILSLTTSPAGSMVFALSGCTLTP